MKKFLVGLVVAVQIVTLIQVSADFASATGYAMCSNNWDDDRDGKTDEDDPACHTDFDANNDASYDPTINSEHNSVDNTGDSNDGPDDGGFWMCENNWDDDRDGRVDERDPGCHTDFDANNEASYDPTINSEHNSTNNTSSGGYTSDPQCADGRDNDRDGKTDSADPDCRTSSGAYNPADNNEYTSCLNGGCTPPPPPTNRAPVCPVFTQQYPTYTVFVGSQFSLDIDATDPDGDSLTYSLTESPSGMHVGASTGRITWTPTSGQAGHTYDVTVRVRDEDGATCRSSFTIRVRVNHDNPCYPNQCPPPPVYDCSDNSDNDGDGKIDYPEDPGCYGPTDDNEYNAPSGGSSGGNTNTNTNSNTNTSTSNNNNVNNNIITIGGGGYYYGGGGSSSRPQCDDNRDNDGDGDYDYPEDRGCSSYSDNTERSEGNNDDEPQCDDNRDNDGDGDYDYPEDRGCSSRNDDSERSENDDDEPQCRDGRDNDRDGDYDYPEDRGCSSRNDDSENSDDDDDEPQCRDGRDNDGDGDRDYPDDRGCSSRNDDSERSGSNNDDDAPYFTSSPVGFVVAGQTYTYNADAISPDGRTITYSLGTRPSGMTINAYTGLVQWFVPSSMGNSYQSVSVRARDDRGNETTQSFTVTVSRLPIVTPVTPVVPVNPRPPVTTQLIITNLDIDDRGGDVIVTFETNREAEGSVRFGQTSELTKTSGFTYPISRPSAFGADTFHEVNLGPLEPNQVYFLRAFATAGSRSAFSPELAYTRSAALIPSTTEVAGTDSCFDGIDNDRDGVADAADSDCSEEEDEGRVAGATFASTLESFGAFLISPWFLLLVIIVLIIYIIVNRRTHEHEYIPTTGPIEIKS